MTELATSTRQQTTRRLRQLLVLLHMTTAFGWLTCSIAMLLLTFHGLGAADEHSRLAVFATAAYLDDNLLADLSFMTVYTGLMLAGLTPWGYLRFWWVTVKMALAITCALTGRAMFAHWLAEASTPGHPVPDHRLVIATILMITAIMTMVWIARTKPWGRINPRRGPGQPWGHPALYVIVLVTPVLDYITDLPLQAIPAAVVLGHHARRTLSAHR
jgi:hypothetical protein